MLEVIRVEGCRFRQGRALWVILLVLLLGPAIAVWLQNYRSAEWCFLNVMRDPMPLLMTAGIFAGVTVAADFSDRGIVPYYILCGYDRRVITMGIFLRYLAGVFCLSVLYPVISTLHACLFLPREFDTVAFLIQAAGILLQGLPLMLGVSSVFFALAAILCRPGAAVGAAVALSIFAVMFGNQLYFSAENGAQSLIRFSPLIQYELIGRGQVIRTDYLVSVSGSMLLLAAMALLTCVVLKRREY